jgi:hypothetical protein
MTLCGGFVFAQSKTGEIKTGEIKTGDSKTGDTVTGDSKTAGVLPAAGSKSDPREREIPAGGEAAQALPEAGTGAEQALAAGGEETVKTVVAKPAGTRGAHSKGEFNFVFTSGIGMGFLGFEPEGDKLHSWGTVRDYKKEGSYINFIFGLLAEYYTLDWLSVSGGLTFTAEGLTSEERGFIKPWGQTWVVEEDFDWGGFNLGLSFPVSVHAHVKNWLYLGGGFYIHIPIMMMSDFEIDDIYGNRIAVDHPGIYIKGYLDIGIDISRNGAGARIILRNGLPGAISFGEKSANPQGWFIGPVFQYVF